MTIPTLVLPLKFSTLTMTSWTVNVSLSWHSLDMIFVAGRKRAQLPSYRKVTSHSVVQVVHKVFMYLIHFPSDFLSRLFLPPWLKETPSIYSYSITLICDILLLSSSTTSYVLMSLTCIRNSDSIEWSMVYWTVIYKWRWVWYSSSSSSITELSGVSPSRSHFIFSKSLLMSMFLTVLVHINEVRPIYLKFYITLKEP